MPRTKSLKAIDLFSGCGGLTQGLRDAGFKVVGAIEKDELAIRTYKLNHPKTRVFEGDIREITPKTLMKRLKLVPGELDLLAGCPPCQGFSTLRTLNGKKDISDPQNDLIFQFSKFIDALEPKTIMVENVPGLYEDGRLEVFATFLKSKGYSATFEVLDAQNYGVPQRRRRFVLLASRGGEIKFYDPLPKKVTVSQAIRDIDKLIEKFDPLHHYEPRRSEKVERMIRHIPKDGGSRKDLPKEFVLPCHLKTNGFKDVYGRMRWSEPSPTITGGCINPSKGRFLHPQENRAITLREAALLQSFPPTYKFSLANGRFPTAQTIGNAFPPKFAQYQALQIKKALKESNF